MPRNGSGTYTLPAGNPVVTGTTISSTVQNNTTSDIATALTNSIAKDGQTTPTANLPMGTYRHTGVGNGVAVTDYTALGQAQNSAFLLIGSIAGTDTITGALTPTLTAYATGQTFRFVSAGANTGAVTINIDSLGAKAITKNGSTALIAGDIPSGALVQISYDGTRFQLSSIGGVSAGNIQDQTYIAFTTGGTSTAFTLTPSPAITALTTNQEFDVIFNAAAGATPTLAISGLTAKNLKYRDSTGAKQAVTSTQIPSGWRSKVVYDGTDYVVREVPPVSVTFATNAEVIAGTSTTTVVSPSTMQANKVVDGGYVATTSGTEKGWTGIPSWAKKVKIQFVDVSQDAATDFLIQVSRAASYITTGYESSTAVPGVVNTGSTAGFIVYGTATGKLSGFVTLERFSTTSYWICSYSLSNYSVPNGVLGGGRIDVGGSGPIDQVRVTTVSGTGNFDGGFLNVTWE